MFQNISDLPLTWIFCVKITLIPMSLRKSSTADPAARILQDLQIMQDLCQGDFAKYLNQCNDSHRLSGLKEAFWRIRNLEILSSS